MRNNTIEEEGGKKEAKEGFDCSVQKEEKISD